ncbi:hypothetical protein Lc367_1831 [Lactobacillus crispatus EM-LC1]|nr:hypothetical protein Lc367_1831 [Lactobacillus crispatus EM-LC1]
MIKKLIFVIVDAFYYSRRIKI